MASSAFLSTRSPFGKFGVPLYAVAVRGLRPGGIFELEAYTPQQIGRGTGGPQDPDLPVSLVELVEELVGLEFIHARELEREVREGEYHTGVASVVQVIGLRRHGESNAAPNPDG